MNKNVPVMLIPYGFSLWGLDVTSGDYATSFALCGEQWRANEVTHSISKDRLKSLILKHTV